MKRLILSVLSAAGLVSAMSVQGEPELRTIEMEIEVDKPAQEVWAAVGGYCDISEWIQGLDCEITEGAGEIGTVRSLAGGRVLEILIAQTPLSYGYTIPPTEGAHYDLYHGFLEARPVDSDTSKLLYTLLYDASQIEDVEADMARRRGTFEGALANMKAIAEE